MTINFRGFLLDFSEPKIMGVVNVNHDSFYKESRLTTIKDICSKAEEMQKSGASIIDLGVMSSRPGAPLMDAKEEWQILAPVLKEVLAETMALLSIDTVWSTTARQALEMGAHLINDISGGSIDAMMLPTVASFESTPVILMHMKGHPENMQQLAHYDDLMVELLSYFKTKIRIANNLGIKDVLIDPGFGFAKNEEQNYQLLKHLSSLSIFDLPIVAGLSRKSMLYKLLGGSPETALNATTAANMIALMHGATLLRVHDVAEAKETITIYEAMRKAM